MGVVQSCLTLAILPYTIGLEDKMSLESKWKREHSRVLRAMSDLEVDDNLGENLSRLYFDFRQTFGEETLPLMAQALAGCGSRVFLLANPIDPLEQKYFQDLSDPFLQPKPVTHCLNLFVANPGYEGAIVMQVAGGVDLEENNRNLRGCPLMTTLTPEGKQLFASVPWN